MAILAIGVYFLYFALSTPESFFCELESRDASCKLQDTQPVCAIYHGDDCYSPTGFCEKTLESSCLACSDSSIVSYVSGECEESGAPQTCTDYDRDVSCSVDDQAVCGYAFSVRFGKQKVYSQDWENACSACNPNHVKFHIPGECQDPDTFGICQKKYKEVECTNQGSSCAYYTGEDCTSKLCRKTVLNSCSVCDDSSILFHIDGSCEDPQPSLIKNTVQKTTSEEDTIKEDNSDMYQEIHKRHYGNRWEEPIPVLQTILQPDGSELIVKDEPHCEVPVQKDIPMLEEVVQPDGSIKYEKVKQPKEEEISMESKFLERREVFGQNPVQIIDSRLLVNEKGN